MTRGELLASIEDPPAAPESCQAEDLGFGR